MRGVAGGVTGRREGRYERGGVGLQEVVGFGGGRS